MKNKMKSNDTRFAIHDSREKGQILLILVMIMAIAITIVLTITFTTRTDTQLTKLEEDSQKALAAAEAGIQSSLKSNSAIDDLTSLSGLGGSIANGTTTLTTTGSTTFVSPKIVSGEAYTAYLGAYTAGSPPTYASSNGNSDVTLCFGDANSEPSLDISILKNPSSTPLVRRYLADPGANFAGGNKLSVTDGCSESEDFAYSVIIPQADISTDSRLLVIRALFASTKILISQANLPAQGKTVTSQATTTTGVTKKVQLFQSHPQIPAEFFFTTF